MSNRSSSEESLLNLDAETHSPEQIENQVQKAQKALLELRQQQEQIEKQKLELEELSRKQHLLEEGKLDIIDKLTRAKVVIERETYECQKKIEQLHLTKTAFIKHLHAIEAIDSKNWSKDSLNQELSRALSMIDDAQSEYLKHRPKVNANSEEELLEDPHAEVPEEQTAAQDFLYWFKNGLAFTLPVLILGLIIAIILWLRLTPPV